MFQLALSQPWEQSEGRDGRWEDVLTPSEEKVSIAETIYVNLTQTQVWTC